jgi:hypothetical protein
VWDFFSEFIDTHAYTSYTWQMFFGKQVSLDKDAGEGAGLWRRNTYFSCQMFLEFFSWLTIMVI